MAYLEELLPEFRKGAKIRRKTWNKNEFVYMKKCTLFNEENLELDGTEMDIWDTFIANDWELAPPPSQTGNISLTTNAFAGFGMMTIQMVLWLY